MSNIIIGNPETYERKIALLNADNTIIVADFDHTMTAGRGESASSFNLLGTIPRLSDRFEHERAGLFDTYYPYEVNPVLSKSERGYWMQEWWRESAELHKKHGLQIGDLENVDYTKSVIRDGWGDFLPFCHSKNIPIHILSAGIGQIIEGVLHHNDMRYVNMSIMANTLTWDADGYNIGSSPNPPIYTGNKLDHTVDVTNKQILLFGDSIDDADMAHPRHDEATVRVAFHNPGTKRTIEEYLTRFDVVIQCSEPRSDGGYLETLMKHI